MQSLKKIYYKDEDFRLEYEPFGDVLFLHCVVDGWKPSSLKRGMRVFEQLKEHAKQSGYKYLSTITPNPKFVKIFKGDFVSFIEHNGERYEVIKWDLK